MREPMSFYEAMKLCAAMGSVRRESWKYKLTVSFLDLEGNQMLFLQLYGEIDGTLRYIDWAPKLEDMTAEDWVSVPANQGDSRNA